MKIKFWLVVSDIYPIDPVAMEKVKVVLTMVEGQIVDQAP
jgi:hypothetical protein